MLVVALRVAMLTGWAEERTGGAAREKGGRLATSKQAARERGMRTEAVEVMSRT